MSLIHQNNTSYFASFKKGKRVYPIIENSIDAKPAQQSNVGYQNQPKIQQNQRQNLYHNSIEYNNLAQNFLKLSLLPDEYVNRKMDVHFLGNPPMVGDLNLPLPLPKIPASASVMASEYSQCDSKYQKCTLNALPNKPYLLKKTNLPLSLIIEPYPRELLSDSVPTISNATLTRCLECKSFINPFIRFIDNGSKWQCNLCSFDDNNVPPTYDWNHTTWEKIDRSTLLELNYGCVDYVATPEFIEKSPQTPIYVFVIDVSTYAVETGMIEVLSESLLESINKIPNHDGKTRIGFITVSQSIGFYSLTNNHPELLIMSDLEDIYLPRMKTDLLVNLTESKSIVIDLLQRLQNMTLDQFYLGSNNCFGSSLKAAQLLLSSTGGKLVCFQASLPNIGFGTPSPSILQKNKYASAGERLLFEGTNDFYRIFSEECVKMNICTDIFIFGNENVDVATLNVIPRFTGGQSHYFPGFKKTNLGERNRLKMEISKLLQEDIGLEAVIRTKCSPGLVCKSIYGNSLSQSPDILFLPNVSRDTSYCIELAMESELYSDLAYIQTCMLYTTASGKRLIRVMTTCLPVVKNIADVFYNADQISIVRSMSHQAIEHAATSKIRDGKGYLIKHTAAIIRTYIKEVIGIALSKSIQLTLCRSLSMIPALVLALLKSEAFNDSGMVPTNISTQSAILLRTLPTSLWIRYVYPNIYSIHNMPIQSGETDLNGEMHMPPRLNLRREKIDNHGCYLLENGHRILIWVGRDAVPKLCLDLFGVPNIDALMSGQLAALPVLDNPFSKRVNQIIKHINTKLRLGNFYPTLHIIKEEQNSILNNWFMTHLLEDSQAFSPGSDISHKGNMASNSSMSYPQWLNYIKEII